MKLSGLSLLLAGLGGYCKACVFSLVKLRLFG